jgi:amino acid adenylation domain-containing protein
VTLRKGEDHLAGLPRAQGSHAPHHRCLHDLLTTQGECIPDAAAILAPGRPPLTYEGLSRHVADVRRTLRALGVGRNDRVALVLPNGPEMAVAFLAVASGATCAPLNPAYGPDEFDSHLTLLRANALLVPTGMDSPARDVARARGLSIIELSPMREAEAGLFTLTGEPRPCQNPDLFAQPDDVALVLHTTGSTSRSKLVPLTHGNLCASAYGIRAALELVPSDRCLNVMPLFHGHGLKGMVLPSLVAGASVICASGFSASEFFAWMATFRPTWYSAVPTIHQAILAHTPLPRAIIAACPLRFIRTTSAFLPPQVLEELERAFNAPVIEAYGTTEASMITCNPLPPRSRRRGSVGMAAGADVAIMDELGTLLPAGEIAEIVARGAAVMHGYENDPEANASAFTRGWFRTGDAGYLDADGYLIVTGRFKELINRGGEKIAPQEVDEVLMDHPAVAQAATFGVRHPRLGEDIAAAVVLRPNTLATEQDIRQFAATRLAAFKVPQQVLIVDDIPKGPTGKVQRIGLAEKLGRGASGWTPSQTRVGFMTPRTPLEEVLAGLWAQVLGLDGVGIHDNFFQLGGDSLLATQLISRVREAACVGLSFLNFLETPTVAGMASSIETASRAAQGPSPPPLRPVPRDRPLPLSYAQQRLWFIEQLGISAHAYNLLRAIRVLGPLHVTALAQSLHEMIRRHEILRTRCVTLEGQPHQVIGPATGLSLPTVELGELPECEREAHVRTLALAEVKRTFNLEHGPLLRATLVRLAAEEHVLLLAMHHIVTDGWSHGVFWRELAALYEAFAAGKPSPLPELSIQYADFAHWQRQWLRGEVLNTQLVYWKRQLAGMSALRLPTDHTRPTLRTFRGARHGLTFSPTLTEALKALSRRQGVTPFMTLLTAFQTLLHRYTGQDDIAVGSLIANRTRAEIEGLIGFFVNTLVLRTDCSGDPTFQELLERVRAVALGAYSHQDLPYEKLLEELRPTRDLSYNPLFQVLFVFQNAPRQAPDLIGLALSSLEVDPETAKFDLMLDLSETLEGLGGWLEYSTDLFDPATIARMAGHFRTLLEGIVADPAQRLSRLPLLTADERHRLVREWNATTAEHPGASSLQELFEAQAERTPDAVALVCEDRRLTYRELNRGANRLAHYLAALGIRPGMPVGICLRRSLDLGIGLLGILKAGGVYLPLDPTYPKERLAFMLSDAQAPALLTHTPLVDMFPDRATRFVCLDADRELLARQSTENPPHHRTGEDLAYVIYTSGSTGQPKGVAVPHQQVLNRLAWMWNAYPFEAGEVGCQKTPVSFVDSLWEWLGPLLQGVPTVIIPDQVLQDLAAFVRALAEHRITRLWVVPSLLRAMLGAFPDLQQRLPRLRFWVTSGEALSRELYQQFQNCMPDSVLYNLYGLSEAWDVSWYEPDPQHDGLPRVPIGRPIANTQTYILDAHLQPVPIGVPGELYVGGVGVARGYVNRPELTAERFIPNGFSDEPGARLYKTGDLARYLPDGNIDYLGRMDHQVKIRGFRLELGEIETVLAEHPAVRQTAIITAEDRSGDKRVIAYMVPAREQASVRDLRSFLKRTLPDYMVPSTFVWLDALPLTSSGKIDRGALPSLDHARPLLEEPFVAPQTPVAQHVAAIWGALLGLEQVGIHDNFFELGGHSLLAIQVVSRIRDAMHVEVPLLSLFETPTVAGFSTSIEAAMKEGQGGTVLTIVPVSRERPLPASIAQEQIWALDRVLPSLPLFNLLYATRLTGALEVAVLEESFNEIVKRHEALRTTFASVEGRLVQVVSPVLHVTLTKEDLRPLPETEREDAVQQSVQEEALQPFDLAQGPLLRTRLLQLSEQEHLLLVTLHHIIGDGWSLSVLVDELAALYDAFSAGAPSPLPDLPVQYADFADWQRQWRHDKEMQDQIVYWKQQLRDPLPVLELSTNVPREAALSFRTARQTVLLPWKLADALKRLSNREGGTLFMTLLAACEILLHGYTGQEDLRVATLVANRTRRETEGLIGLFVNTVILRTDLGGDPTCREVLRRVWATTLAAYAHQDLPCEELVQTLERERGLKRASLCQVMVILQNAMQRPGQRSARTLNFLDADLNTLIPPVVATTFDVVLMLRDRPEGLTATCIYKNELLDAATIDRLLADFERVLECLVEQPERPLSTFRSNHP